MGSTISLAGPRLSDTQIARVRRDFRRWERAWSRFRPGSALCRLNRRAGHPTRLDRPTFRLVETALAAAHWTDGLVTPTILPALLAAGYDRTFADLPADSPARPAPPLGEWSAIRLDPSNATITLPVGSPIDLGGVAKGYLADRIVRRHHGPILIDAGGDIALSGPLPGGAPWPIGIDDPLEPDRLLALVAVAKGGVATSGRDFRRWRQGGQERHHLIDPRTGEPARTDVLTATVVASSAVVAEAAAKVVLLRGAEAGLRWIAEHPSLAALVVREDGSLVTSRRFETLLWKAS